MFTLMLPLMFLLNAGAPAATEAAPASDSANNAPTEPAQPQIQPNPGEQPQLNVAGQPAAPSTQDGQPQGVPINAGGQPAQDPNAQQPVQQQAQPQVQQPAQPPQPLQLGQPVPGQQMTAEQQIQAMQQKMQALEVQNRNMQYMMQQKVNPQQQNIGSTSAQQAASVQTGQAQPEFDENDVLTFGGAKGVMKETIQQVLSDMKNEQDTQKQWEDFYNSKEQEILASYDLNVNPQEVFPKIHFFATYLMHQGVDPQVAYQQATYGHLMQKGQGYGQAAMQPAYPNYQQQALQQHGQPYGVNGVAPQGQVQGNVPIQQPGVNTQQINGQNVVQAPTMPGSPETPGQLIQPGNAATEVARLKQEADALLSESRTSEQGYRRWMEANRRYKSAAKTAAANGRLT